MLDGMEGGFGFPLGGDFPEIDRALEAGLTRKELFTRIRLKTEEQNRAEHFKEVADVLGHQSLQTTGIYATLDLVALSEVALPWIGDPQ